jgi:hypothetical protein
MPYYGNGDLPPVHIPRGSSGTNGRSHLPSCTSGHSHPVADQYGVVVDAVFIAQGECLPSLTCRPEEASMQKEGQSVGRVNAIAHAIFVMRPAQSCITMVCSSPVMAAKPCSSFRKDLLGLSLLTLEVVSVGSRERQTLTRDLACDALLGIACAPVAPGRVWHRCHQLPRGRWGDLAGRDGSRWNGSPYQVVNGIPGCVTML